MRREKIGMTRVRGTTRKIKNHITREETIVERLILVMNGIPEMRALVKRKVRKLQLWHQEASLYLKVVQQLDR
jgi:hypothetical protein